MRYVSKLYNFVLFTLGIYNSFMQIRSDCLQGTDYRYILDPKIKDCETLYQSSRVSRPYKDGADMPAASCAFLANKRLISFVVKQSCLLGCLGLQRNNACRL